jgi:hypothetical protein
MKNKARDGRQFIGSEQSAYNAGYQIGKARKNAGEFMGSAHTSGFRGRNRLIFNEGLEDGHSGVVWSEHGACIQIREWKCQDFVDWKGTGARITFLWPPGTFHDNTVSLASISNGNMPFCGSLDEEVPLAELREMTGASK